ncbi:hypothetical protein [Marinobacter sp.]|uniref:hypothetical protein n=1 Tax=Marinobacter sp. TaxID=50741 RepID=UPI003565C133
MKRLISLSVPLLTLAIAGCGEESDQLPVDGRDFDGVSYSEPVDYEGRVIDGYLRNARVWLDLNDDGQYNPGPLSVTLANGETHILQSGEPTDMTTAGGRFTLDTDELQVDELKGKDLDPRDYPLYALALPGKTMEETRSGEVAVKRAYLMSASPGVTNVTPLTTLARFRAEVAKRINLNPKNVAPESSADLNGLNLLQDYILSRNEQAHAYARALARFMASQTPDDYNSSLARENSDGTERFLSRDAVYLLGISLVQNAADIIQLVDDAASGENYDTVDTDAIELPVVPVELENPVLLTSQTVSASAEGGGSLPASNLEKSAELRFDYTEDGQLLSVSSRGCMEPSLPELARLVQVNGYIAKLKNQWHPSASLSEHSKGLYDEGGIHERLVFDWDNERAYFDTVTSCHLETRGISPDSSELDGTAEMTWSWNDKSMVVEVVSGSVSEEREISLLTTEAPDKSPADVLAGSSVTGYRIASGGALEVQLAFKEPEGVCEPKGVNDELPRLSEPYVTLLFPLEIAGEVDAYEYDVREYSQPDEGGSLQIERLQRYPLKSLSMAGPDAGDLQWQLYYSSLNMEGLDSTTANLIREAYLERRGTVTGCGMLFRDAPNSAYAQVTYGYKTLTEYLIEGLAESPADE